MSIESKVTRRVEAARAMRLADYLMRASVRPGDSSSLNAQINFARNRAGKGAFTVRLGQIRAEDTTLAGALIAAFDQAGVN